MIPREILKKIRQIELRTNRIVTETLAAGARASARFTARSPLADANEHRDWRIFADFAHVLIQQATVLYAEEPFRFELQAAAYPTGVGYRYLSLSQSWLLLRAAATSATFSDEIQHAAVA